MHKRDPPGDYILNFTGKYKSDLNERLKFYNAKHQHHLFDLAGIWAVKAVLTAERPLLIRGEPGTGKSQFARAVATLLGRAFLYQVVNARSNCHDLQYVFDAVSRLGEAQILGAGRIGQIGNIE